MDVECIDRFADWLSFHLSNFDYKWNWTKWSFVQAMKEDTVKKMFVREVLEKCVRLSYWERVRRTIPDELALLMMNKPLPILKYSEQDPDYALYQTLIAKMRNKEIDKQILQWLHDQNQLSLEVKVELTVNCVAEIGSKSFSHLLNALERYNTLLRTLINNSQTRGQTISAFAHFWRNSSAHIIIALDKLMTYRIIDNISIVNWLFSNEVLPDFTRGYVWDILRNTVNKTVARTETVRKQLAKTLQPTEQSSSTPQLSASATQEALETAEREQKELLLVVFQRFCISISNHLTNCEANNTDPYDYWYYSALGHLKEIGRKFHEEIRPFISTLESILFTSEVDSRITSVFHQFKMVGG